MTTLALRIFRHAAWSWLPAFAFLIFINVLSAYRSTPSSAHMGWNLGVLLNLIPRNFDALAHFSEFSLLALLLWWPLRKSAPHWSELKAAKWVFGFGVLSSIIDESHQALVLGRNASLGDAVMDILGLAVTLAWLLNRKRWQPNSQNT